MATPLYMELDEALQIVQGYAEMNTDGDLTAGLEDMQECYDDLDKEDRVAYTMVMAARDKQSAAC